MNVRFRREAADEVREARAWYAARDPELGGLFLAALESVIAKIADRPLVYPAVPRVSQVRRARMKRFPFAVMFRVLGASDIEVLAIAHVRRRPGYWNPRL